MTETRLFSVQAARWGQADMSFAKNNKMFMFMAATSVIFFLCLFKMVLLQYECV
jgi:hypothetical protein